MSSKHNYLRVQRLHARHGSMLIAIALIGILLISGCAAAISEDGEEGANQSRKAQSKGSFKVVYSPVKNQEYAEFQKELKDGKVLEAIAANLNSTIALPSDITITFAECGQVNAFYDPEKRQISMCYELIENFHDIFSEVVESEDELGDAIVGATIFVFFHEVGHALVHVLELPITGKEEDAVDQLSTFILTDGTDEGEQAALNGALSFFLANQQQDATVDDLAFWGEHSLDQQRFYNIICWVYGQNEEKYGGLVENGTLPEDRAQRCAGEYAQLAKSWGTLLVPHIKK